MLCCFVNTILIATWRSVSTSETKLIASWRSLSSYLLLFGGQSTPYPPLACASCLFFGSGWFCESFFGMAELSPSPPPVGFLRGLFSVGITAALVSPAMPGEGAAVGWVYPFSHVGIPHYFSSNSTIMFLNSLPSVKLSRGTGLLTAFWRSGRKAWQHELEITHNVINSSQPANRLRSLPLGAQCIISTSASYGK